MKVSNIPVHVVGVGSVGMEEQKHLCHNCQSPYFRRIAVSDTARLIRKHQSDQMYACIGCGVFHRADVALYDQDFGLGDEETGDRDGDVYKDYAYSLDPVYLFLNMAVEMTEKGTSFL